MKNKQRGNIFNVDIQSAPTIYEELGNGKLRVVDPSEFGIAKRKPPEDRNLLPIRSPNTFGFSLTEIGSLTIHEEMPDGRMRLVDPAELGIKAANAAPRLG